MQTTTPTNTQLHEFATNFEKEFPMFSCLSTNTNSRSAWYLDSGDSHHVTGTHEMFTEWSEIDSNLHVELHTLSKCGVEGLRIVGFQMYSKGFLEVAHVLYVPELKKKLLSVLVLEHNALVMSFQRGKVLMCSKGASPNIVVRIDVKDGNLYRLQG
jgi:hypothetical protein